MRSYYRAYDAELLRATQRLTTPKDVLSGLLEYNLPRTLRDLASDHCVVCDDDLLTVLRQTTELSETPTSALLSRSDLNAAALSCLDAGKAVIALSLNDPDALVTHCQEVLGPHAQVISFTRDIVPWLSCRRPPAEFKMASELKPPSLQYLLVSGGRTGSTLIMEVLRRNGLGEVNEHLRPPVIFLHRLGNAFSIAHWFESVRRLGAVDGTFGTKFAPHFFLELWPHLSAEERDYFQRELSAFRIVYSYRRDKVMQAVSLFRAEESSVWAVESEEALGVYQRLEPPRYDFDKLFKFHASAVVYDLACEQLLAPLAGSVLSLSYEELVEDRVKSFARIAAFLDIPGGALEVGSTQRKTGDDISLAMAERFRADYLARTGKAI